MAWTVYPRHQAKVNMYSLWTYVHLKAFSLPQKVYTKVVNYTMKRVNIMNQEEQQTAKRDISQIKGWKQNVNYLFIYGK